MIFDYLDFIEDKRLSTPTGSTSAKNPEFFGHIDKCPFCKTPTVQVANERAEERASEIDEHGIFRTAVQCFGCGWWRTDYYDWHNDSYQYWDAYGVRYAIMKAYNPKDSAVPMSALRRALLRNPDLIDRISKRKTEELVGSIFSDFFCCESKLVGKSHDGGIDLVLVISDRPILVQVKHREKRSHNWKAEPVSTIREFLGAVKLAESDYGIFVTTAHHFSRPALEASRKALSLNLVQQFDLVDGAELFRMLNLVRQEIPEHWRENLFAP